MKAVKTNKSGVGLALFRFPRRHRKQAGALGLEVRPDGIAVAHVVRQAESVLLNFCEFISFESLGVSIDVSSSNPQNEAVSEILATRLKPRDLKNPPCNLVLEPSQYTLLQVDAPKVPEEEMREAVRWRVKDLVGFPVSDAILDIFDLPSECSRGDRRLLYAVIVQREPLVAIIDMIREADLQLQCIDISELALRNFAQVCADDQRGLAIVKVSQGSGSLSLIKQGNLYFSRQFDMDYNGGLFDALPEEKLVLELQRSLDYYERQLGQLPPAQILFTGENFTSDKITASMRSGLQTPMALLEAEGLKLEAKTEEQASGSDQLANNGSIKNRLEIKSDLDSGMIQLCALAIGGAMRQMVA